MERRGEPSKIECCRLASYGRLVESSFWKKWINVLLANHVAITTALLKRLRNVAGRDNSHPLYTTLSMFREEIYGWRSNMENDTKLR